MSKGTTTEPAIGVGEEHWSVAKAALEPMPASMATRGATRGATSGATTTEPETEEFHFGFGGGDGEFNFTKFLDDPPASGSTEGPATPPDGV